MHTPTPREIAFAFDLGEPTGDLVHVRRGDNDAWRPVEAREGWLARIEDRLFRVHRWIEHAPPTDVSTWLGRTMAQVHALQPIGVGGLPQWWRDSVRTPETWARWFAAGRRRGAAWAAQYQEHALLEVAERIVAVCAEVPDLVTTHGDFKPHNIVSGQSGPVLVDWDSVRTDSAALEAARVAYIFGEGEPGRIERILTAYTAAGGDIGRPGPDLFLSVLRNHLQVLGEHLQVSLGEAEPARWMGDGAAIEVAISNSLRALPGRIEELSAVRRR